VKKRERKSAAATRDLLLDAATSLMAERRSPDISLADIAERTGMSRALVIYYFGSKEGMLLAVLDLGVSQAVAGLAELAVADLPVKTKLRMHISGLVRTYIQVPYANQLLQLMMLPDNPGRAHKVAEIYVRPLSEFYQSIIEQGAREGVFRVVDARLFYFMLVGATEHFTASGLVMSDIFGEPGITEVLQRRYEAFLYETALGVLAPGERD
jgi:AcrR family transcriptional regulator